MTFPVEPPRGVMSYDSVACAKARYVSTDFHYFSGGVRHRNHRKTQVSIMKSVIQEFVPVVKRYSADAYEQLVGSRLWGGLFRDVQIFQAKTIQLPSFHAFLSNRLFLVRIHSRDQQLLPA